MLGDEEPWLDDTAAWVERSRKLAKEKEMAEKRVRIERKDSCRDNQMTSFVSFSLYQSFYFVSVQFLSQQAKLLEEMDEEFGVSNLVEQEFAQEKRVCDLIDLISCSLLPQSLSFFSTKTIFKALM